MDSELNKLRAEKVAMQKIQAREREEKAKLIERIEDLESLCKRKNEEIEALQLNYNQLIHRCESLQEKLTVKPSNWGMGWWGNSGKQQKEQERIKVLEEDLINKISENEQVHIKNFELRRKYKNKIAIVKDNHKEAQELVKNYMHKVEALGIEINQYQASVQRLFKENKEYSSLLDNKNKEIQDSHNYFIKMSTELKDKIHSLQTSLKSVVSLDLSDYNLFSLFNCPKFNRNFHLKQSEWLQKLFSSLQSSCPTIEKLLLKYSERLENLFFNSSPNNKKLISIFTDFSKRFCDNYKQSVSILCEKTCSSNEILKILAKEENDVIYLLRVIKTIISKEDEIISDYEKANKINNELMMNIEKVRVFVSRGVGISAAAAFTKQSLWGKVQDICKNLVLAIGDMAKILIERLSLDKYLKYSTGVKDVSLINDDIVLAVNALTSFLSHFCSEIMQLKAPFYYSTSPFYHSTANYLTSLRQISQTPGIPYQTALVNVKTLSIQDRKLTENTQTIANLEKNNQGLQKDIEKYKAEVLKIENELAAVEQNLERKVLESGKDLLHEPESISEDVKNGAQRFALRLTDFNGEPTPLSTLTVSNDLYLKIQEIAVSRINELAEQLKIEGKLN